MPDLSFEGIDHVISENGEVVISTTREDTMVEQHLRQLFPIDIEGLNQGRNLREKGKGIINLDHLVVLGGT